MVADDDAFECDFGLAFVRDLACRLRCKVEKGANSAGGVFAGAQFEHLPEQHEHCDDGRGLIVDRYGSARPEHRRKKAGERGGDDAVDPGDAGSECNQREHVEVVRDKRSPGAREERPPRPPHDRGGERELQPWRERGRNELVEADKLATHSQYHNRNCENDADQKAAPHVGKLKIVNMFASRNERFQRHAADRATAGTILPYLGMHRACVDRTVSRRG